jgi:hypothetical protein
MVCLVYFIIHLFLTRPTQRKVYRKHPGVKFWDELDKRLAKIRAEAKGDMKQVTRYH